MFCCLIGFLATIALYYLARYLWELIPIDNLKRKAVFITGCDSGFGRQLALKCANNGIAVFAGCLTQQGTDSLNQEANGSKGKLYSFQLDVTSDDSVRNALKSVEENLPSDMELWAIVNNAGICSWYGPDDWCSVEEYKLSMDVNFFGVIRTTHAFKPLLKRSQGRIITMSSVSGRVVLSGGGPYSTAKFAIEAYMDAVRQELYTFNVKCSIIEPGLFKTTFTDTKAMEQRVTMVWDRLNDEQRAEYGEEYKNHYLLRLTGLLETFASKRTESVVDCCYHAITAKYPRCRYHCGLDSVFLYMPLSYLPTEFIDTFIRFFIIQTALPAAVAKKKYA